MDLSVVIVSYNVRGHLERCLRSIFSRSHKHEFEVLVVDNASRDDSAAMVQSHYPQAKLIVNARNRGFAAANNQGIAASRGRYVLLLNPDSEVVKSALDDLVALMDSLPSAERVGIVSAKVYGSDGKMQVSCCPFLTTASTLSRVFYLAKMFPHSRSLARHRFSVVDWDRPAWTDWVTGACLMIRREVIEQIGLMDEGFFLYYEEVDWCFRAKRAGWKVLYWPGASVIHFGSKSVAQAQSLAFEHSIAGLLRYYAKHHRRFDVLAVHFAVLLRLVATATGLPALVPSLFGRPRPVSAPPGRQFSIVFHSLLNQILSLL